MTSLQGSEPPTDLFGREAVGCRRAQQASSAGAHLNLRAQLQNVLCLAQRRAGRHHGRRASRHGGGQRMAQFTVMVQGPEQARQKAVTRPHTARHCHRQGVCVKALVGRDQHGAFTAQREGHHLRLPLCNQPSRGFALCVARGQGGAQQLGQFTQTGFDQPDTGLQRSLQGRPLTVQHHACAALTSQLGQLGVTVIAHPRRQTAAGHPP